MSIARKQTSFRLKTDLLDSVYNTPNAETLAAMQEVEKGIGLRKADTSNLDAFIKSCGE